jgi:hypothetical protein
VIRTRPGPGSAGPCGDPPAHRTHRASRPARLGGRSRRHLGRRAQGRAARRRGGPRDPGPPRLEQPPTAHDPRARPAPRLPRRNRVPRTRTSRRGNTLRQPKPITSACRHARSGATRPDRAQRPGNGSVRRSGPFGMPTTPMSEGVDVSQGYAARSTGPVPTPRRNGQSALTFNSTERTHRTSPDRCARRAHIGTYALVVLNTDRRLGVPISCARARRYVRAELLRAGEQAEVPCVL